MVTSFSFAPYTAFLDRFLGFRELGFLQCCCKKGVSGDRQSYLQLWRFWRICYERSYSRVLLAGSFLEAYVRLMHNVGPELHYDPLVLNLPDRLCALLWESGYRKALVVDGAFDDEVEALELIDSLEGINESTRVKSDWAVDLMMWKVHHANSFRRVRGRIATAPCDVKVVAVAKSLGKVSVGLPSTSVLASTVMQTFCKQTHWRTRLSARLASASGETDRSFLEAREKARWTDEVIRILKSAEAPICAQASLALDCDAALSSIVGKKRAKTLRARVRPWLRIRLWLSCVHGTEWPRHIGEMLDYIHDFHGECAKSLPVSIACSLAFFEKISGSPSSTWISTNPLWRAGIDDLVHQLQSKAGGMEVRKAPQYPIAVIIAMELYVTSVRPNYARAFCWTRLVKVWCSLRADDLQGLDPSRLTLTPLGLKGVLTRTKTTGPGKGIGEVAIYIHAKAGFSGSTWLRTGFLLWQSEAFSFKRDYFLPGPGKDADAPGKYLLLPSHCSALGRKLLLELHRPVRGADAVWREGEPELVPSPGHLFWSEHSERHWGPSVATAIGVSKDRADYLGRWAINAKQSHDYALTSKQVVLGVQVEMSKAVSHGPSHYEESELIDSYGTWLAERDPGVDTDSWTDQLQLLLPSGTALDFHLSQPWPLVGVLPLIPLVPEPDDFGGVLKYIAETVGEADSPFWASVGRTGFTRLHREGGCRTAKSFKVKLLTAAQAEKDKSDSACKLCWPDLRINVEESQDGSDSEEDGSTSSSSGNSTEGECPTASAAVVESAVVENEVVESEVVTLD